jgi:hypothetical protein
MFKIFINDLEPSQLSAVQRVKEWASWADQEARNRANDSPEVEPSVYWALTSHIHSYMNDLPAKLFNGLRLHTYHLDGDTFRGAVNAYSGGGAIDGAQDLYIPYGASLRSQIPERYWIGAPHACGEYGHMDEGRLINVKVLTWQKIFGDLWHSGVFPRLEKVDRPVILEIGAGYGGVSHHMNSVFPNSLYFVVDLPTTLLFSAAYLTMLHGPDKVILMDESSPSDPAAYANASIVMVPNFLLSKLESFRFDCAINMDSFQEMTESQVTTYLEFLAPRTDLLYSKNLDEFENTTDKVAVSTVLRRYFDITPIAPWPTGPLGLKSPYKTLRRFAGNIRRKLATYTSAPRKGGDYLAAPKTAAPG